MVDIWCPVCRKIKIGDYSRWCRDCEAELKRLQDEDKEEGAHDGT